MEIGFEMYKNIIVVCEDDDLHPDCILALEVLGKSLRATIRFTRRDQRRECTLPVIMCSQRKTSSYVPIGGALIVFAKIENTLRRVERIQIKFTDKNEFDFRSCKVSKTKMLFNKGPIRINGFCEFIRTPIHKSKKFVIDSNLKINDSDAYGIHSFSDGRECLSYLEIIPTSKENP
jgi:hypothetical protein